jgi:hypothetical protein
MNPFFDRTFVSSTLVAVGQRNGCRLNGPTGRMSRIKYWLSTLPEDVALRELSTLPSCDGGSNATIRIQAGGRGLRHFQGRGGAASTITATFALRPTDS